MTWRGLVRQDTARWAQEPVLNGVVITPTSRVFVSPQAYPIISYIFGHLQGFFITPLRSVSGTGGLKLALNAA